MIIVSRGKNQLISFFHFTRAGGAQSVRRRLSWGIIVFLFFLSWVSILNGQIGLGEEQKQLLKQIKVVRLTVESSTWRENEKPYDVGADVRKQLENERFKVVDKGQDYDVELSLIYKEEKGPVLFIGSYGADGTSISCSITLSHKKIGLIFKYMLKPMVPLEYLDLMILKDKEIEKNPTAYLYKVVVLPYFKDNPLFKYLGKMIEAERDLREAQSVLFQALTDYSTNTQRQAAKILGELGNRQAIEPLFSRLKPYIDSDIKTLMSIQEALKKLDWKPKDTVDIIYFYLGTYHLSEELKMPIKSLDSEAIAPLIGILLNTNNNWLYRENAAIALGDMKAKEAVNALKQVLSDPNINREVVKKALEQIQIK